MLPDFLFSGDFLFLPGRSGKSSQKLREEEVIVDNLFLSQFLG